VLLLLSLHCGYQNAGCLLESYTAVVTAPQQTILQLTGSFNISSWEQKTAADPSCTNRCHLGAILRQCRFSCDAL
jgi:hypothetical protein